MTTSLRPAVPVATSLEKSPEAFNYRDELSALVAAYDNHWGRLFNRHEDALFLAVEHARTVLDVPEKPVRPTISSLSAGQAVLVGYKYNKDVIEINTGKFLGFKQNGSWFSTLKHLKEYHGSNTLRELEAKAELLGSDFEITAKFSHLRSGDTLWDAYLYNGAFRIHANSYRLVLEPIIRFKE